MRNPARAALLVAIGLVATALAGLLVYFDRGARFSLALPAVLTVVGVGAIAAGVSGLRAPAPVPEAEAVDYKHTYRLFAVLGIGLAVALLARCHAVPESFGERGFYRGDARREAMVARTPRLQGSDSCVECHKMQSKTNAKDVHRTVQCEDCHGPGDAHVKDPKSENIVVNRERDACLVCHRMLSARPGPFAQVAWKDHFKGMGVTDEKTPCISCHDAHEPLFLEKPLAEARLHPLIHRCRDCHTGKIAETAERPPRHPVVFECAYCHAAKAADFDKRPHGDLKCTTCHLFIKESDFSGRIVLNSDPRFCLLCHAKSSFRDGKFATTIEWPKHLVDVNAKSDDEDTPCTTCHRAVLHGEPGTTPRVGGLHG